MTVRELIAELQKFHPDQRVFVANERADFAESEFRVARIETLGRVGYFSVGLLVDKRSNSVDYNEA